MWRNKLPMELEIQSRLRHQNHPNIHRFLGFRIDKKRRRWRQYHEVCDLGTLDGALRAYRDPLHPRVMGEGFLWHVFDSFVEACIVLDRGNWVPSIDKHRQWKSIVHTDICPANIFLSYPLDNQGNPNFNSTETHVKTLREPGQMSHIIRVGNGADVSTSQITSRVDAKICSYPGLYLQTTIPHFSTFKMVTMNTKTIPWSRLPIKQDK